MNLYRGHILAASAVCFGATALLCIWFYSILIEDYALEVWVLLILIAGMLSAIVAMVTAALAYAHWVPKWERDEKRTGHFPGEERKQ